MSGAKKNPHRSQFIKLYIATILSIFIFAGIAGILLRVFLDHRHLFSKDETEMVTESIMTESELQTDVQTEAFTELQTEPQTEPQTKVQKETESEILDTRKEFAEESIYTFLQGPKSWKFQLSWSGEWSTMSLAGSTFGEFGCGLCCLANIYSTVTDYHCSPLDMYYYAKDETRYHPGGGVGAIDWRFMRAVLQKCGFTTRLHQKDAMFDEFCEEVENSMMTLACVSCYYDSSYWKTTPGHYVTLWNYNPEDGTVFLGDSGDPSHNRQRIPLVYVYNAMNMSNTFQYMSLKSYNAGKNTWQHDGTDVAWYRPGEGKSYFEVDFDADLNYNADSDEDVDYEA